MCPPANCLNLNDVHCGISAFTLSPQPHSVWNETLCTGVEKGECHISGDLITSLFSASTRGGAPYSNTALTVLHDIIALVRSAHDFLLDASLSKQSPTF